MTSKKKSKILPRQEWLDSLPAKRVATQVMFWNLDGEVLLVKPNYRDDWLLPGGIVEANESPIDGMLREIKEELSFEPEFLVYAGTDFNPETSYKNADFIHIFFDGGFLSDEQVSKLTKEDDELDEMRFFKVSEIDGFATPQQAMRIRAYRESYPTPVLLTHGERVDTFKGGQSFAYTTIVVSVMIEDNGKYLLVQEEQASAHGMWNFPSGRVDTGESIEQAAVREAKEEANIDVVLGKRISTIQRDIAAPVVHTFEAMEWGGTPQPQEGEILAVEWFSIEDLRELKKANKLRGWEYSLGIVEEYERNK